MNFKNIAVVSAILVFTACAPSQPEEPATDEVAAASSVSSKRVVRETKNVSYSGIVKPAGISIYMEGTHRLQLDDGRFILLESDSLDLNGYVNEKVDVFGSIRPTVESDAIIMRVTDISLEETEPEIDSEELDEENVDEQIETPEDEQEEVEDSQETESDEEETEEGPTEEPYLEHSAEQEAQIAKMATEDFGAQNWTREYCTGHIGFCVPVHKNWYFKSFGATSSSFWHVEMSRAELDKLRDGPISVRLVSGSLASIGANDGDVVREQHATVGYRSWTDNRHFEIIADGRLEEAIQYITDNLSVYTE